MRNRTCHLIHDCHDLNGIFYVVLDYSVAFFWQDLVTVFCFRYIHSHCLSSIAYALMLSISGLALCQQLEIPVIFGSSEFALRHCPLSFELQRGVRLSPAIAAARSASSFCSTEGHCSSSNRSCNSSCKMQQVLPRAHPRGSLRPNSLPHASSRLSPPAPARVSAPACLHGSTPTPLPLSSVAAAAARGACRAAGLLPRCKPRQPRPRGRVGAGAGGRRGGLPAADGGLLLLFVSVDVKSAPHAKHTASRTKLA
jgi:hypothetical protein